MSQAEVIWVHIRFWADVITTAIGTFALVGLVIWLLWEYKKNKKKG